MSQYDAIRRLLSSTVPFAAHAGVELVCVGDGTGEAVLAEQPFTLNHVATQHAGALFTLGEAASGAAMAGGFMPVLAKVRPVAATANIQYLKVARGMIRAHAKIGEATEVLRRRLEEVGKVQFPIEISMTDQAGTKVATMQVDWHVSSLRPQ